MSEKTRFDPETSVRRHLLIGGLVAAGMLFAIGGWAGVTRLSGAVIANGSFVVTSYVKKVQHPDGGVVKELLVHEGQQVAAGDVLLRLDATQTRANLAVVRKRLNELEARQARLEAERDGLDSISFPTTLTNQQQDPDIARARFSEAQLFKFRSETRKGEKAQFRERIAQYEMQITGLKAQQDAYAHAIAVLDGELTDLRGLQVDGLVTVVRMNELDREAATFRGELGKALAGQAEIAGMIAETRLQIIQIEADMRAEVGEELRDIQGQIGEYVERYAAAKDRLMRINLVASQNGVIHELAVHASGAVVSPAETIMMIVPYQDELTLEVRVEPADIDQIHLRQKTVLRLSAFNQRTTPELNGRVSRIAADLTKDEATGLSYYRVWIALPPEEMARLEDLALMPGMPAEAFIQTGERTALSYVFKPLSDQINRAFREE
ncbi:MULTISPECIES: HlyD family type I secretion periplasmic adaptor subunit [Roseobacteraceae]|uniref:Membrane fusion protein (MFP) family protein n=1 Tax=Pseudosulfitobacter pseudonitzschiae TaxID=1402135 RepID=A0A221K889_9RHOB|nr:MULTISPECIES: HlyD family type I secretion periplasmic adaptor subunit [Roseobacteraceae]ASM75199.1 type I secretion system membrane fusion protein PrsE [Pseudosulfitobacter pseudonitzschiae]